MKKYAFKDSVYGYELKKFRELNDLTRKELSDFLNVSIRTLEGWETSDKAITGPIVTLFRIIQEYPEYLNKYEIPKQVYPLRMFYMENGNINTLIDVNISKRKVSFKNYTSDMNLRAFGPKEEVSYEEYEEFLESRCFPSTRDKSKILLDELGIPFYDPLLIIEKTGGRMADDDCYIEIVKGTDNDWFN